jgi:hypothetical protein
MRTHERPSREMTRAIRIEPAPLTTSGLLARITALYLVSHPVMVPVACPVAQRSFSEDWQSTMSTEQGLTPREIDCALLSMQW